MSDSDLQKENQRLRRQIAAMQALKPLKSKLLPALPPGTIVTAKATFTRIYDNRTGQWKDI